MRRNIDNSFGKDSHEQLRPPYLTPQELSEFRMEFTLFGDTVNAKELLSTAAAHKNKLMSEFLSDLSQRSSKLTFEAYLQEVEQFISDKPAPERNELLYELLTDGQGQLNLGNIHQLLQETSHSELSQSQVANMLADIVGNTQPARLSREQYALVMIHKPSQL